MSTRQKVSKIIVFLTLVSFSLVQPLEISARSKKERGFDAFGMAGGAALITSTPMSGRSISTMIRNSAIAYAVPKYLNKPLGTLGASFVGGALSGGFAIGQGGFDFKWNNKAMFTQGVTSMATVGVTDYGYKQGWDRKLPGLSNLAGNVAGNFSLWGTNKLLKAEWGTMGGKVTFADYGKGIGYAGGQKFNLPNTFVDPVVGTVEVLYSNKAGVSCFIGDGANKWAATPSLDGFANTFGGDIKSAKKAPYILAKTGLQAMGFQPGLKSQLGSFLSDTFKNTAVEYVRLSVENKFTPSNNKDARFYHKAAGSLTSGAFSGLLAGRGLINGLTQGAVSGITSAGLNYLSKEMQEEGVGSHTAAMINLGLSAGIYASFSDERGGKSRLELAKTIFKENTRSALGSFGTFGLATLTPTGDLYYHKSPDASFYSGMHDLYRTAEGLPNSSWSRNDWKVYDTTGKIPEHTKGLGNALVSRLSSALHYEAVGNITNLMREKMSKFEKDKKLVLPFSTKQPTSPEQTSPLEQPSSPGVTAQSGIEREEAFEKIKSLQKDMEEKIKGKREYEKKELLMGEQKYLEERMGISTSPSTIPSEFKQEQTVQISPSSSGVEAISSDPLAGYEFKSKAGKEAWGQILKDDKYKSPQVSFSVKSPGIGNDYVNEKIGEIDAKRSHGRNYLTTFGPHKPLPYQAPLFKESFKEGPPTAVDLIKNSSTLAVVKTPKKSLYPVRIESSF